MAPTDQMQAVKAWREHDMVDRNGSKIGKVADIYMDEDTGRPEWAAVATGLFGTKVSFVPLDGVEPRDDVLVSRWTKDQVKDAPRMDADGRLSEEEEAELYRHYGMSYGGQPPVAGRPDSGRGQTDAGRATGERSGAGHDTSGPNTDSAMTRSEAVRGRLTL